MHDIGTLDELPSFPSGGSAFPDAPAQSRAHPQITATVLNPDSEAGPWKVELVLTDPDGRAIQAETIEHQGDDWNAKAAPVIERMRARLGLSST